MNITEHSQHKQRITEDNVGNFNIASFYFKYSALILFCNSWPSVIKIRRKSQQFLQEKTFCDLFSVFCSSCVLWKIKIVTWNLILNVFKKQAES